MIKKQRAGEPITHWIYAGPYELDVSNLYENNYTVPVEPYRLLIEEARTLMKHMKKTPVEGEPLELYKQRKEWALHRSEDTNKKVTWAKFGTFARMMVTYAYTQLKVDRAGSHSFKMWAVGSVYVHMNGKEVFSHLKMGREGGEYSFEVEMKQGLNDCVILLSNVHLHCMNSFSLRLENTECEIQVPLVTRDQELRERIEKDIRKFHVKDYLVKPGGDITVCADTLLSEDAECIFTMYKGNGKKEIVGDPIYRKSIRFDKGKSLEITLCNADDLEDPGVYIVCFVCMDSEGNRIQGGRLICQKVLFGELSSEGGYPARKKALLQNYAQLSRKFMEETAIRGIYHELAKLEAEKYELLDEEAIRVSLEYIKQRYDCADFVLHGVLRMYYKFKNSQWISEELKQQMKRCILDFKYSEEEPGKSMMFTRSENHQMLFYSAEYLAGLLFPLENFTNSNQNGLFHALKGRVNSERWIKEKGTYGFMEWHSNTYYEEDMITLLNIYDFGEESSYIRLLSKSLLDLLGIIISTHSFQGVLATTHGRSYENSIIYPETEPMSHINWLLIGKPKVWVQRVSMGAVTLAGSKYVPHAAFEKLADAQEEMYSVTQMGLFPHNGNQGVNCATYRTKDYMVSGLVESKMGSLGQQVHAGQVLMDGNVPVFVTCFDNKSEETRPSYWGGQYRVPKTITHKNFLAYIYRIGDIIGYTHCYFPFHQFDATLQKGKWLFGCKNDAYIALYSLKDYERIHEGPYKDRELLCMEKKNIWMMEMGRKEQWSSFEAFVEAVSNACLIEEGEDLIFESPSLGRIELGWDRVCTIKGIPVIEKGFPLLCNPFAYGEYGTGITSIVMDGQKTTLNFTI